MIHTSEPSYFDKFEFIITHDLDCYDLKETYPSIFAQLEFYKAHQKYWLTEQIKCQIDALYKALRINNLYKDLVVLKNIKSYTESDITATFNGYVSWFDSGYNFGKFNKIVEPLAPINEIIKSSKLAKSLIKPNEISPHILAMDKSVIKLPTDWYYIYFKVLYDDYKHSVFLNVDTVNNKSTMFVHDYIYREFVLKHPEMLVDQRFDYRTLFKTHNIKLYRYVGDDFIVYYSDIVADKNQLKPLRKELT